MSSEGKGSIYQAQPPNPSLPQLQPEPHPAKGTEGSQDGAEALSAEPRGPPCLCQEPAHPRGPRGPERSSQKVSPGEKRPGASDPARLGPGPGLSSAGRAAGERGNAPAGLLGCCGSGGHWVTVGFSTPAAGPSTPGTGPGTEACSEDTGLSGSGTLLRGPGGGGGGAEGGGGCCCCCCCCSFFLLIFLSLARRFWNQIFT